MRFREKVQALLWKARLIVAKKMSRAEKDAMERIYHASGGRQRRRDLHQPSNATLDRLEARGFIRIAGNGSVGLTPWGRNVARMIAGDM